MKLRIFLNDYPFNLGRDVLRSGTGEYPYVHMHDLPDGRIQAVYYDGPEARHITRLQIVHRDGEGVPEPQSTGPSEYRCAVCRNWGTGIGTVIEWARPFG